MTPASYYDFHQPTNFLVDLNDHQDQALLPLCHDLHNHSNDQVSLKLVLSTSSYSSSSSSSLSSSPPPPSYCPNFFSPCPDQGPYNNHFQRTLPYPQEVDNYVGCNYGSYGQQAFPVEEKTETGLKFTIFKEGLEKGSSTATNEHQQGDHQTSSNPFKWMSSKTRIMRKMMKSNHQINVAAATAANPDSTTTSMAAKHHHHGDQEDRKQPSLSSIENDSSSRSRPSSKNNFSPNHNDSSNNDALIRVCADCNTTKTPLWRSGPNGPKSLCNACGIRQRKARRALAAAQAAAAAANGSTTTTTNLLAASSQKLKTSTELYHNKDKRLSPPRNGFVAQQKKRSKISNSNNNNRPGSTSRNSSSLSRGDDDQSRKLCFEEFAIDLSNKLSLDRVFPQEEKEAAILLMALSSGALVHG